jgi:hypothetical protein
MLDGGGCFANGVKGTNGLRLVRASLRVLRGVKPADVSASSQAISILSKPQDLVPATLGARADELTE